MAYKPEAQNIYQGKQVIINSDRLIFNAKEDSILLFSHQAISFSTNGSVHFDTKKGDNNNFIINCPNIYLGLDSNDDLPTESAVLGEKLEEFLNEMLDMVQNLWEANLTEVRHTAGQITTIPSPMNFAVKARIEGQISSLRKQIDFFKSKTVKLN